MNLTSENRYTSIKDLNGNLQIEEVFRLDGDVDFLGGREVTSVMLDRKRKEQEDYKVTRENLLTKAESDISKETKQDMIDALNTKKDGLVLESSKCDANIFNIDELKNKIINR